MKYCKCFFYNKNDNANKISKNNYNAMPINDFSQIEYDKTISQVYQLKQKLLGKRIKNIETYNII